MPAQQYAQGQVLFTQNRYQEAMPLFQSTCDRGVADACNYVGWMYGNSFGVAQDFAQARAYYQRACEAGSATGCSNLGNLYYAGQGVAKNYPYALLMFQRSCDDGGPYGCNGLGLLYENGWGVARDAAQAISYYTKACNGGIQDSCTSLHNLQQVIQQELARQTQSQQAQQLASASRSQQPDATVQQMSAGINLLKPGELVPGTGWRFEEIDMVEGPVNWSPVVVSKDLRKFGTNARYLYWVFQVDTNKKAGAALLSCTFRTADGRTIGTTQPEKLTITNEKGSRMWWGAWGNENGGAWKQGRYRLTCALNGTPAIDEPFEITVGPDGASADNLNSQLAIRFPTTYFCRVAVTYGQVEACGKGDLVVTQDIVAFQGQGDCSLGLPCGKIEASSAKPKTVFKLEGGREGDTFSVYFDGKRYRFGSQKADSQFVLFLRKAIEDFPSAYAEIQR